MARMIKLTSPEGDRVGEFCSYGQALAMRRSWVDDGEWGILNDKTGSFLGIVGKGLCKDGWKKKTTAEDLPDVLKDVPFKRTVVTRW